MSMNLSQETIERRTGAAELASRRMPALIDKIRNRRKPIDLKACYHSLASDHLVVGFWEYFIRRDIEAFKNHLFIATRLKTAALAIDDLQRFDTGSELFHALLSDCREVINEMAGFEGQHFQSARENPLNPQFKVHMWQLAVRGDFTDLERKVERLAKNGRKQDRIATSAGKDFFSLLLQRDVDRLTKFIAAHASVRNDDALTEDYLSYFAALEAKICWYHGIEVDIQNEGVPMALMPVRPLAHYNQPYEFLEPGWQPPATGWKEKLAQWLGRG
ncbi:Imm49 family immunity protein [Cupriavidus campinensis]